MRVSTKHKKVLKCLSMASTTVIVRVWWQHLFDVRAVKERSWLFNPTLQLTKASTEVQSQH